MRIKIKIKEPHEYIGMYRLGKGIHLGMKILSYIPENRSFTYAMEIDEYRRIYKVSFDEFVLSIKKGDIIKSNDEDKT